MSVIFWNGEYIGADRYHVIGNKDITSRGDMCKLHRSSNGKFYFGSVGNTPCSYLIKYIEPIFNAMLYNFISSSHSVEALMLPCEAESALCHSATWMIVCNDFCIVYDIDGDKFHRMVYDSRLPVAAGSGELCALVGMYAKIHPKQIVHNMSKNTHYISKESDVYYTSDLIPYVTCEET